MKPQNDNAPTPFEPAPEAWSIAELLQRAARYEQLAVEGNAPPGTLATLRIQAYAEATNLRVRALLLHAGLTKVEGP